MFEARDGWSVVEPRPARGKNRSESRGGTEQTEAAKPRNSGGFEFEALGSDEGEGASFSPASPDLDGYAAAAKAVSRRDARAAEDEWAASSRSQTELPWDSGFLRAVLGDG